MRFRGPLVVILASNLAACGGCGDDAATDPDAEIAIDPDAEPDPDAGPDDPPPGPVTGLTASPDDPAEVDLIWTNPSDADLAGALVVVSPAAITFAPADGTSYSAAQDLGGGQTVLAVGASASATLTAATVGVRYHFSVWAFDGATQYSTAATTRGANNTLDAQTATLSISLAGVVTVTAQPADLTLSGTAVYTDGTDTLDVDLGVQNDTGRLIFNLKALTTAQNEGGQAGNLFPLTGGQPSTYFGPEALDVGATATRSLNLTGITGGADPITVNLTFVDAPMLFTSDGSNDTGIYGVDTSGSGETFAGEGADSSRQAVVSQDGRTIYVGSKIVPSVTFVDTTTYTAAITAGLGDAANGLGGIGGVALSTDGSKLFAIVNDGAHWHGTDGGGAGDSLDTEVALVELSTSDLTELRRLPLYAADPAQRMGRELQVSPDGARAALVVAATGAKDGTVTVASNELWLIDLATFTAIDADAVTAGTQPVLLGPTTAYAAHLAWSGDQIYVAFNNGGSYLGDDTPIGLEVVDTSSFAVTSIAAPAGAGSRSRALVVRGGKLYYPSRAGTPAPTAGLVVIDGLTVTTPTVGDVDGVVFDPTGTRYYVVDQNDTVTVMDATTNAAIDTDGDGTNGVTPLTVLRATSHTNVVSPF